MPIDAGTLAGYDQLLSISQEAVQRQLEMLYGTQVEPPIPGGPTHLINHEMHFHLKKTLKNGKVVDFKDGIDAYVCCPKIEFGGQSISDEVDKYRTAVIRFKFRRAEDWEVGENTHRDSIFTYKEVVDQDEEGRDVTVFHDVVINDWEISWNTLIDKKDIQDVLKEIINPANSSESNVSASKGLKDQLGKFTTQTVSESGDNTTVVQAQNFQISTIFCAMQSSRLVQSFKLVDQYGKRPTELKTTKGENVNVTTLIDELMLMIQRKFTSSDSATASAAPRPTPDNPFILGYTISSKTPDPIALNPAAAEAKIPTPAYFIPKTFRCNLSPSSNYSAGTLNYCMLTHRAMQPPDFNSRGVERHIDDGIDGAGRFKENVFARLRTRATPGSAEGALFIAQDIFVNHWIGSSVAPLFHLNPQYAAHEVAQLVEQNYKQLNIHGAMKNFGSNATTTRTLSTNSKYKLNSTFRSDRAIIAQNKVNDPTESIKLEYDSSVEVSYENTEPLRDDDDDLKRRLKFTIGSYTKLKLKFYRRLAVSHVGNFIGEAVNKVAGRTTVTVNYYNDSEWEEAYDVDLWLNYKYSFEIGTSASNRGSFEVPEDLEISWHMENGQLKGHNDQYPPADDPHAPGLWKVTKTHNWASTFEFAFDEEKSNLTTIGDNVAKNGAALFRGAVKDLVKSLGATVILPAGEVFTFKGFSTDEFGNVFTVTNYDTSTDDTVNLVAAKDISTTRWVAPEKPTK